MVLVSTPPGLEDFAGGGVRGAEPRQVRCRHRLEGEIEDPEETQVTIAPLARVAEQALEEVPLDVLLARPPDGEQREHLQVPGALALADAFFVIHKRRER